MNEPTPRGEPIHVGGPPPTHRILYVGKPSPKKTYGKISGMLVLFLVLVAVIVGLSVALAHQSGKVSDLRQEKQNLLYASDSLKVVWTDSTQTILSKFVAVKSQKDLLAGENKAMRRKIEQQKGTILVKSHELLTLKGVTAAGEGVPDSLEEAKKLIEDQDPDDHFNLGGYFYITSPYKYLVTAVLDTIELSSYLVRNPDGTIEMQYQLFDDWATLQTSDVTISEGFFESALEGDIAGAAKGRLMRLLQPFNYSLTLGYFPRSNSVFGAGFIGYHSVSVGAGLLIPTAEEREAEYGVLFNKRWGGK